MIQELNEQWQALSKRAHTANNSKFHSLCHHPTIFIFGDKTCSSFGKTVFVLPTPKGEKSIAAHVIHPRITLLLGLDTLDLHGWNVLTVQNQLQSDKENWKLPLYRKFGHIFLQLLAQCFMNFSWQELQNIHLHFMHPSTTKLINLLHRAYPEKLKPDSLQLLTEICKSCYVCPKHSFQPITLSVRFTDEIVFNPRITMVLMYLNGTPVPHIVDYGKSFSATSSMRMIDTKTVWETFVTIWINVYTGFPNRMHLNQGSAFKSVEWVSLCRKASIDISTSGTESQNLLEQGETYHAMLRRIYQKVRHTSPQTSKEFCPSIALKTMNDTYGPNGLVPSLLPFGEMPKIPTTPHTEISLPDRHNMILSARQEFESIIAKQRIHSALSRRLPPSHSFWLVPGQPVYVYHEKEKHWTGPHLVTSADGKAVFVDLGERTGSRHLIWPKHNLHDYHPFSIYSIRCLQLCHLIKKVKKAIPLQYRLIFINDIKAH